MSQPRCWTIARAICGTVLLAALAAAPAIAAIDQSEQTAKDPVCGMTVKVADAKYTSTVDGKTYYFCAESCKKKFDKEPARYVKPAGDQAQAQTAKDVVCGMSVKVADAKYMSDHQGKIYYFCSESCKKKFDQEPAKYIK
jgi:Cu+-exporting ATPase